MANIQRWTGNFDFIRRLNDTFSLRNDVSIKFRFCGSKLQPGQLTNTVRPFGLSPVVTKANGPMVIRFHTDDQARSPLRLGFRIRYEQSSANCQNERRGAAMIGLIGRNAQPPNPHSVRYEGAWIDRQKA